MDKKKLISIGIVVLTIVVVVIIAATSGGNSEPEVIPTESTTNIVTENDIRIGYSAEVLENSLKVYKDDVFVQELKYPTDHNGKFVLGLAKNHIAFLYIIQQFISFFQFFNFFTSFFNKIWGIVCISFTKYPLFR